MKSIKVTVVGDSGVGKTSILNNFVYNDFKHSIDSTIGAAYYSKQINYNDEFVYTYVTYKFSHRACSL